MKKNISCYRKFISCNKNYSLIHRKIVLWHKVFFFIPVRRNILYFTGRRYHISSLLGNKFMFLAKLWQSSFSWYQTKLACLLSHLTTVTAVLGKMLDLNLCLQRSKIFFTSPSRGDKYQTCRIIPSGRYCWSLTTEYWWSLTTEYLHSMVTWVILKIMFWYWLQGIPNTGIAQGIPLVLWCYGMVWPWSGSVGKMLSKILLLVLGSCLHISSTKRQEQIIRSSPPPVIAGGTGLTDTSGVVCIV